MRQGSENGQFSDPTQYKTLVQAAAQAYELSRDALLRTRARTHEDRASAWSTIRGPATREAGVGRESEKSVGRRERCEDMAEMKVESSTTDWPPTWPREDGWPCNIEVPECPSQAWHDTHLHGRTFASLEMAHAVMAEYGGSDPT